MAYGVVYGYIVLAEGEGLTLQSGPDRDLIFKVTGEDTGGAFDYSIVETGPKAGPPLHVHHDQEETIHVLKGLYKIQIGEEFSIAKKEALPIFHRKSRTLLLT